MRNLSFLTLIACFFLPTTKVQAQENFTEGSVWRITLIDIKPGKSTEFWQDLRKNLKPIWEENKKQGIITSYAVQLKTTVDEPGDWDVSLAFEYKNFAALDGLTERMDPISLKAYGSVEARREALAKRPEYGSVVASYLTRQVTLKDLPR